ncbi:MAG: helix-hairpin-helix domain-containing protein [Ethanoligenens sp.]
MKAENKRFLVLLSAMTAVCCVVVVVFAFKDMPLLESTAGTTSATTAVFSASSATTSSLADAALSSSVPSHQSETASVSSVTAAMSVHINTADAAALASLPGIGDTLAQRIIDYRNAHGPFSSVAQLDQVKGIGPKKLSEIAKLVTL